MKQKTGRKLLSFLLTLAMVLGLMPGMSLTAYAATAYASGQVYVQNLKNGDIINSNVTINKNTTTCGLEIRDEDGTTVLQSYAASQKVSNAQPGYVTIVTQQKSGSGSTVIIKKYTPVDVTDVSLNQPTLNLLVDGEKATLTTSVAPDNATFKDVTWSSTDSSIARVDNNGVVTPVSSGTAKITAASWDGLKSASCDVTVKESTYTITIPSTLTVSGSGWNATDGISATGELASSKKLIVTASSDDEYALVSGENKVGYKLATASTDTEATTSWVFDTLSSTTSTKPMGIIVEDYTGKPAGTYQDTVTFTASVEDARQLYSFTLTGPYSGETLVVEYYEGDTWNDMVAKYPNTLKIYSGRAAFGSDGFIYDHTGSSVSATAQINPNETYEVQ